ncbi:MAG: peptide-methionine (S)-S-oxide reductase MsrA [Bacilli bacterium]|nr:peptide-methionine (S)-S-oxide reductase MsrA [Bacilli bacterium]
MKRIVLAGGCFWGVEGYYKILKGVINTNVGYTNGNIEFPTYEDLLASRATHAEAIEIYYDENQINLEKILEHMFRFIDPTSLNKQGGDVGIQYRTGVYYRDLEDKQIIDMFMDKMNKKYNNKVAVEVEVERGFYLAEEYHQDYLDVNPNGYCHVDFSLINEEEKK